LDSLWTTSKAIPVTAFTDAIAANEVLPLGGLLDALAAQKDLRYSGYGVLAIDEAVVASIAWGDTVTAFAPFTAGDATDTVTVSGYDIALNKDEYDVWHEE